jgi:tetrahydromethanopterin S-methyltransferase subunit H
LQIVGIAEVLVDALIMYLTRAAEVMILFLLIAMRLKVGVTTGSGILGIHKKLGNSNLGRLL